MFLTIALITIVFVIYLSIRDWIRSSRITSSFIQKNIKAASQHISLGNWEEALERLTPLIESGKGGKEVLLLHIQVLRGTHCLKEALAEVLEAARRYPEELLFRMEEGLILSELDRPKEALEAFRVCTPIMRTESDFLALSSVLNRAGYSAQAFELLEPWIKSTQNGELFSLVGDIFFERKQFQQAVHYYLRALKQGYQTHHVTTQLAHAFRRLGNLAESEKIFRKLLEKNRADILATLGLGACMQERGHFQKALLIYQSSGAWEKKDPRLLKEAGLCALRSKKFSYAAFYFRDIIRQTEPDATLLAYYALALEYQNEWQEAEQVYLKLIQLFPSCPHGYRALAWMFGVGLSQTLSQDQGLNFAHIALKLKNDSVSWEILSACEARMGHFERAYQIQMTLSAQDSGAETRSRRQQALRNLRKQLPLDGQHVIRSLVA